MVIFTETMANLVKELATYPGVVETEVSEETVSIRFYGGSGRLPKEAPKPTANGKFRGRPRIVRSAGGRVLQTFAYDGETHTVAEWAKKYGCSEKAMRQRFVNYGRPCTINHKSKSDKSTIKGKASKQ